MSTLLNSVSGHGKGARCCQAGGFGPHLRPINTSFTFGLLPECHVANKSVTCHKLHLLVEWSSETSSETPFFQTIWSSCGVKCENARSNRSYSDPHAQWGARGKLTLYGCHTTSQLGASHRHWIASPPLATIFCMVLYARSERSESLNHAPKKPYRYIESLVNVNRWAPACSIHLSSLYLHAALPANMAHTMIQRDIVLRWDNKFVPTILRRRWANFSLNFVQKPW